MISEPAINPRTISRTRRWRRRSDIGEWCEDSLLRRRQHKQKAAVVVIGGKQVCDGLRREVALGIDGDALAELADAPLEHGADVVLPALEVEPEHVAHLAAHDLLVGQAGQLARAAGRSPPRRTGRSAGATRGRSR